MDLTDPRPGRSRRTEHFRLGQRTPAELDRDGDGKMDARVRYDALGEEASRAPM